MLIGNTSPDGSGYHIHQVLSASGQVKTDPDSALAEAWEHAVVLEEGANSVVFTTATDHKLWVLGVYAVLVSSSTSGNRMLAVEMLDSEETTLVFEIRAGTNQAASLTRKYTFAAGIQPGLGGFTDSNFLQINLPPHFVLPPGYTLRVRDLNEVDGTGDTLTVYLTYATQQGVF